MTKKTFRRIIPFMVLLAFLLFVKLAFCSDEAAYKYNESGLNKLRNNNYQGAINDLKTAHLYSPANNNIKKNLSIAYNNYAFYLMNNGNPGLAIEKFEQALNFDQGNPFTLYNIGQAYYRIQDMKKAKVYLSKAYALKPELKGLRELLDKVSGEEKVEKSFGKYETMHFVIAYSSDLPVNKLSYIRTYLEEGYGRVGMFLDQYPANKVIAILYSENNYDQLLHRRPHWTMAIFDGKLRIPVNKFKYTDQDVIKIVYHEYAHALVHEITKGNCPLWLNEGIASKAEDFVEMRDRDLIKKYISHFGIRPIRQIPQDFSHMKDMNMVTLMYIESYLLVDFIVKRVGNSGLKNILEYLGMGMSAESALEKVFGDNFDKFEDKWKRFIVEEYGIRSQ